MKPLIPKIGAVGFFLLAILADTNEESALYMGWGIVMLVLYFLMLMRDM